MTERTGAEKAILRKAFVELGEFLSHNGGCVLGLWHAGRPKEGGGYENDYNGVWYESMPVDKTPKCECGLDQVVLKINEILK